MNKANCKNNELAGEVIVMDAPYLKEAIAGQYKGKGRGQYPTIDSFEYDETIKFTLSTKGFLVYSQSSSNPIDRTPMHSECGYLRVMNDLSVELLISQPTGISEVATGTALVKSDGAIEIRVDSLPSTTPTAKLVTRVARRYCFDAWGMRYELDMAMENVEMTLHLVASLTRGGSES